MIKYVVKEEHTLGYLIEGQPGMMGVLAGSVLKGGHDWKNGPVPYFPEELRPARKEDFEIFRVVLPPDF